LLKEAFFFQKPCITLMDETEWTELVEHGFNVLVGARCEDIITAVRKLYITRCDCSVLLNGAGDAEEKLSERLPKDK